MAHWLAAEYSVAGVAFQGWMPVAVGIVVLFVLYHWMRAHI